jgi:hypothetical protein
MSFGLNLVTAGITNRFAKCRLVSRVGAFHSEGFSGFCKVPTSLLPSAKDGKNRNSFIHSFHNVKKNHIFFTGKLKYS